MTERLSKEREKYHERWTWTPKVFNQVQGECNRIVVQAPCDTQFPSSLKQAASDCQAIVRDRERVIECETQVETLTLQLETARKALEWVEVNQPHTRHCACMQTQLQPIRMACNCWKSRVKQALADMKVE